MGMYNAIIPDELLFPLGVYKERLSQSALYHAASEVPETEARAVYEWLRRAGMTFHLGQDDASELTEAQVLGQCRTYIAGVRMAEAFGCETIGIQYQQGLKDLLPASDLAEGLLNNDDRPPVLDAAGKPIRDGQASSAFFSSASRSISSVSTDSLSGLPGFFGPLSATKRMSLSEAEVGGLPAMLSSK